MALQSVYSYDMLFIHCPMVLCQAFIDLCCNYSWPGFTVPIPHRFDSHWCTCGLDGQLMVDAFLMQCDRCAFKIPTLPYMCCHKNVNYRLFYCYVTFKAIPLKKIN